MEIREVIKSYNANITQSEDCSVENDYVVVLKEYSHNPLYEVHIFNGPQMVESIVCSTFESAKAFFYDRQVKHFGKVIQYAS